MLNKIFQIISGATCLAVLLSVMMFSPKADALQVRSKTEAAELSSLNELRWKYRLILIRSESQAQTDKLIFELESKQDELVDRKLVVFIVQSKQVRVLMGGQPLAALQDPISRDILTRLADYQAILIGLDGGVKASYDGLRLNEIFRDIDGMPMRRGER
jgi:hypothetical protein